jgi:hypothetical protein
MKLLRLIIFLIVLASAIFVNIKYLELTWFKFTGLFLTAWLVYGFFANFIVKLYKNKKGIPQEKYAYAFPDKMAAAMKKIDMRTQIESALLSMFFILIGMVAMDIYLVFFMNLSKAFLIIILFNSVCGAAFLLTSLIGQYQSYVTYMTAIEPLLEMNKRNVNNSDNSNIITNMDDINNIDNNIETLKGGGEWIKNGK